MGQGTQWEIANEENRFAQKPHSLQELGLQDTAVPDLTPKGLLRHSYFALTYHAQDGSSF
ncbi:hypothetical protein HPP92_029129 [Vanilla planifolia]|uniref:Uncharacterized protein n=1 Tax=Vanilla planifolia TaxID=51239 RepID=A0A835P4S3_VANPL|nr:hypothetical protein HPP92_029129 [Vanilla planifolia]KAG0445872.1 hypothetical protein HPP92_029117 [Vanilla planifolia]